MGQSSSILFLPNGRSNVVYFGEGDEKVEFFGEDGQIWKVKRDGQATAHMPTETIRWANQMLETIVKPALKREASIARDMKEAKEMQSALERIIEISKVELERNRDAQRIAKLQSNMNFLRG
jgi:hypothetical protein